MAQQLSVRGLDIANGSFTLLGWLPLVRWSCGSAWLGVHGAILWRRCRLCSAGCKRVGVHMTGPGVCRHMARRGA